MPKFWGLVRLHYSPWLRGVVGHIRKDCRTSSSVFLTTTLHQLRVRTQTVAPFDSLEGIQTMTATTQQASRCAAPAKPTPSNCTPMRITR